MEPFCGPGDACPTTQESTNPPGISMPDPKRLFYADLHVPTKPPINPPGITLPVSMSHAHAQLNTSTKPPFTFAHILRALVCTGILWGVMGCQHTRSSAVCEQAETLHTEPVGHAPLTLLPWEVDRLATPLPGTLEVQPHVSAHMPAAQDMWSTTVALFYLVWRRTWGKFDMTRCDLHPSCSRFALDAVRKTSLWLALPITFARVMSNHQDDTLPRDRFGQKRDPVSHYTFAHPRHHHDEPERQDPAIRWFEHARAIKQECPR